MSSLAELTSLASCETKASSQARGVGAAAVGRLDDAAHGQLEGAREREVAAVVRRDGHDRAGAVPHQHVVGDEDGDPFAADRVDARTRR